MVTKSDRLSKLLNENPKRLIPEDWIPSWWHGEPIADEHCKPLYGDEIARDRQLDEWCRKYCTGK